MRAVVLIAGLMLSAATAADAQSVAVKSACEKPANLMAALSGLFGRSECRAPTADRVPGSALAVGQPVRRETESATAVATDHAAPPRLAGSMCREALPSYDAGGQAIYLPSRACGRY